MEAMQYSEIPTRNKKTVISDDQKLILRRLYRDGMTSKGKQSSAKILQAETETGLSKKTIKDWIGNEKKREEGRQYEQKAKKIYTKGPSGFNLFVHEKKETMPELAEWGAAWKQLSPSIQQDYRVRAQAIEMPLHGEKQLLSNLHDNIQRLAKVGCTITCLGLNSKGSLLSFGVGKAHNFIEKNPHITQRLYTECCVDISESVDTLRKKVTVHLRNLHEQATASKGPFPYKKVTEGKVVIQGLPEDVMPLRLPSHYGVKKLKSILKCTEISVVTKDVRSPHPKADITNDLSADQDAITAEDVKTKPESEVEVHEAQITENQFLQEEAIRMVNEMSKGTLSLDNVEEIDSNVVLTVAPTAAPKKKRKKTSKSIETQQAQQLTKKIKGEEVYLVEDILKEGPKISLVKWIGFPEPTWEKNENIIEI